MSKGRLKTSISSASISDSKKQQNLKFKVIEACDINLRFSLNDINYLSQVLCDVMVVEFYAIWKNLR